MKRILPILSAIVIALIVFVILPQAVRNEGWSPTPMYSCPYDDVSEAGQYVFAINYAPYEDVQAAIGGLHEGIAFAQPYAKGMWQIVISDNLNKEQTAEALSHELCHVYDVEVMGRTLNQTVNHEGWLGPF